MILLSDANVLIDLGYVGGVSILPRIAPSEVLDVVLQECEHESQPDLVAEVRNAGVVVVETDIEWLGPARAFRTPALSAEDTLNLYYAKTHGRVLLAGDRPLRESCQREGIEVRGSIWLVEEAFSRGLVPAEELCRWLREWPRLGRRLPKNELLRLAGLLGCGGQ